MARSVTEKSRPRTIQVWLANVAKCFDDLELSQTHKTELLRRVLLINIAFGQAAALRQSTRPVSMRKRNAKSEADAVERTVKIIESMIFRPTLKGGRVEYSEALRLAAPMKPPPTVSKLPALGAFVDSEAIQGALSFLRRLTFVLREVPADALDPFAIAPGDGTAMRAFKEALSGRGKAHQTREFVSKLLAVWGAATGIPISRMKIGNPDSGPGKLLRFLVAASSPILEIPRERRGTIGPSSLRRYATEAINFATRYGDKAVEALPN